MHAVRRGGPALVVALAGVLSTGIAQGATIRGCADPAPGGDWPSYGGTVDNHRDQTAEKTITTANVGKLGLRWRRPMPDGGTIQSPPVVADGCVFTGTSLGTVVAVDADDGAPVWTQTLA